LVAIPGPVAISWLALPLLVDASNLQVPLQTLQIATAVQSILLVALASAIGALLSAKVGLRAPALSAIASRSEVLPVLRQQLFPGVLGGLFGAVVIIGFYLFAPSELATLQTQNSLPLVARVLYGGITEEVLLRWGLMTFMVWAGWRILQRGTGNPSATVMWLAIGISALIFGISHVPSVVAAMGVAPASVVAYVTLGNGTFGIAAGYIFWRYGLEAAMAAHVIAHVLAFAVRG